jgi:putative MFS transporter
MMLAISIFALGGIASTFATGFASMILVRMCLGLGLGGQVPIAATYINEIAPAAKRGSFVLLYEFVFAAGIVVAGFLGRWSIPAWGWQSLFLIGSIPPLFVLLLIRTLPESPRWLVRHGKLAQAEAAISRIEQEIRASGKDISAPKLLPPAAEAGSGHWTEIFSTRYRTRTLLIWITWITIGFISWPLTIWLPTLYRNIFRVSLEQALNFGAINNVIILVATLSCALLIDRVGRKAWFTGAFVLAGASLCALDLLGGSDVTVVFVLTALTLFGISSLNLAIYLYTPELYPTRLRAQGVGIALAWARVAGMVAPPAIGWGMDNNGLNSVFAALA